MEFVGISSNMAMTLRTGLAAALLFGCSSNTSAPARVLAAPPPQDDGRPSEGGAGGSEHAAALEQLKTAPMTYSVDRQGSLRIPLPDSQNWMRVKFWGVKSLVGYRYGKEHHAIVAGFVMPVADNSVSGACVKSFESFAMDWIRAFDVELVRDPPTAVMWKARVPWPNETDAIVPAPIEIEGDFAKTATLLQKEAYAGAWAAYPAWRNRCLIVGVAVPSRDNDQRAKDVRDRFIREVLPKVEVLSPDEPPERY